MEHPEILYTSYGTFSLVEVIDGYDLRYAGNELITNGLVICAAEYDGVIIARMPELFREDAGDDRIRYFTMEGMEIHHSDEEEECSMFRLVHMTVEGVD